MSGHEQGGCPSALDLDRWVLAGRPSDHEVSKHAVKCEGCRGRVDALAKDSALREQAVDPVLMEQRIDAIYAAADSRRAEGVRSRLWSFARPRNFAAVSALAVLVFALVVVPRIERPDTEAELGWKASGDVALQVRVGGSPRPAGAALAPGVVLVAEMTVARTGYLALVSIEEDGRVSRILPARGAMALRVETGVLRVQGGVTPSIGIERMIVLFDPEPFEIGAAVTEIRRGEAYRSLSAAYEAGSAPRIAASWWFRHARGPE